MIQNIIREEINLQNTDKKDWTPENLKLRNYTGADISKTIN